jgi:hypothetical protein
MCQWNKYGSFRIDPCILNNVSELQSFSLHTIASCCGHVKYKPTIIIQDGSGNIYEFFSEIVISQKPRKSKRYYKRDNEGYFYIPEVEAMRKERKQ